MFSHRVLGGVALAASLVVPATARATCWAPAEIEAAHVHAFKTMMLVTALQCRSRVPQSLESYNAFVRARGVWLGQHEAVLRARFAQGRGHIAGLGAVSDYETGLGNRFAASQPDWRDCKSMAEDASYAIDASPEHIAEMGARMIPMRHEQCIEAPRVVTVAEVVADAQPRPLPEPEPTALRDEDDLVPMPADAVTVPVGRIDPAESARAPVVAAVADPPAPIPTAADALANAAIALAAAAEAMRPPVN